MSSQAYVDDGRDFLDALTRDEERAAGDYGNARERLARKLKIGKSRLKNLCYGTPKTIDPADFEKLGKAYGQRELYKQERTAFTPRTLLGQLLVRAVDFALDETDGTVKHND